MKGVSLRKYLESRIDGLKEYILGILDERVAAVRKEAADAKDRANASNEIRGAMVDQQKNFADKEATDRRFEQLKELVDEIKRDVAASKNKAVGGSQLWVMIGAVIFAVAAINGIIFVIQGAH